MTCSEIENQLVAYMEGILSPEDRKNIEGHLASCLHCSRALAGLKKTEELLHNLEDVEPPPFFEQRIMARIREDAAQKKGILRRLFYPLYIKVPVQVVATLVVAVFAFYLYQKGEPEMKQVIPLQIPVTEDTKSRAMSGPSGTVEEQNLTELHAPIREETSLVARTPSPPVVAREKDMPHGEAKALNAMRDKAETRAGGVPEKLTMQQMSKEKAAEKRASIDMTMYVEHAPGAIREIEERLSRFNARIIDRQHRETEEILRIEIAGRSVAAFLDQLKTIGSVEEGKIAPAAPDGNATLIIKIKEH